MSLSSLTLIPALSHVYTSAKLQFTLDAMYQTMRAPLNNTITFWTGQVITFIALLSRGVPISFFFADADFYLFLLANADTDAALLQFY